VARRALLYSIRTTVKPPKTIRTVRRFPGTTVSPAAKARASCVAEKLKTKIRYSRRSNLNAMHLKFEAKLELPAHTRDNQPFPAGYPLVNQCMDDSAAQREIDALVANFFSALDNRDGATPRLADLIDCFTDKATIVRRSNSGAELYTVKEFAIPRIELLTQGALLHFHEWETCSTTQIFDGIAIRTSRYGKSGLLDGNDFTGSGTKCFQLVDLDTGWRIASLAWVDDNS